MNLEDLSLEGQRAMVTGAAGGIGKTTAQLLANLGCSVVVADVDQSGLEQTLRALRPQERPHHGVCFDLADPSACESSVQAAATKLGALDIVIHAGAMLVREPIGEISPQSLQRTTAVNMWGAFFIARRAAALMAGRGGGSIVLFSSQGAYTGGYGNATAYSMTKAAVGALVKSLAREFATQNVRVNGIAPGAIDTPMLRDGMTDEALERFLTLVPMQRLGTPLEIATCCAFLASPASRFMTGQILHVNGGQLML